MFSKKIAILLLGTAAVLLVQVLAAETDKEGAGDNDGAISPRQRRHLAKHQHQTKQFRNMGGFKGPGHGFMVPDFMQKPKGFHHHPRFNGDLFDFPLLRPHHRRHRRRHHSKSHSSSSSRRHHSRSSRSRSSDSSRPRHHRRPHHRRNLKSKSCERRKFIQPIMPHLRLHPQMQRGFSHSESSQEDIRVKSRNLNRNINYVKSAMAANIGTNNTEACCCGLVFVEDSMEDMQCMPCQCGSMMGPKMMPPKMMGPPMMGAMPYFNNGPNAMMKPPPPPTCNGIDGTPNSPGLQCPIGQCSCQTMPPKPGMMGMGMGMMGPAICKPVCGNQQPYYPAPPPYV